MEYDAPSTHLQSYARQNRAHPHRGSGSSGPTGKEKAMQPVQNFWDLSNRKINVMERKKNVLHWTFENCSKQADDKKLSSTKMEDITKWYSQKKSEEKFTATALFEHRSVVCWGKGKGKTREKNLKGFYIWNFFFFFAGALKVLITANYIRNSAAPLVSMYVHRNMYCTLLGFLHKEQTLHFKPPT